MVRLPGWRLLSLPLHAWKALQVSSARTERKQRRKIAKKGASQTSSNNNKAFMQKDSSGRAKKIRGEGAGRVKKNREKGNIQEAQAESEAYKRISIIVDVIIIFHFQSKRYPIIAPQRLPTYLPFFLFIRLSLSCRTQHKESPRIKPTFHLFTRNVRVELKCFLLLLFKRATRRWLKQTNRTSSTTKTTTTM